jgi:hypothetical protein
MLGVFAEAPPRRASSVGIRRTRVRRADRNAHTARRGGATGGAAAAAPAVAAPAVAMPAVGKLADGNCAAGKLLVGRLAVVRPGWHETGEPKAEEPIRDPSMYGVLELVPRRPTAQQRAEAEQCLHSGQGTGDVTVVEAGTHVGQAFRIAVRLVDRPQAGQRGTGQGIPVPGRVWVAPRPAPCSSGWHPRRRTRSSSAIPSGLSSARPMGFQAPPAVPLAELDLYLPHVPPFAPNTLHSPARRRDTGNRSATRRSAGLDLRDSAVGSTATESLTPADWAHATVAPRRPGTRSPASMTSSPTGRRSRRGRPPGALPKVGTPTLKKVRGNGCPLSTAPTPPPPIPSKACSTC